eukprot:409840_1
MNCTHTEYLYRQQKDELCIFGYIKRTYRDPQFLSVQHIPFVLKSLVLHYYHLNFDNFDQNIHVDGAEIISIQYAKDALVIKRAYYHSWTDYIWLQNHVSNPRIYIWKLKMVNVGKSPSINFGIWNLDKEQQHWFVPNSVDTMSINGVVHHIKLVDAYWCKQSCSTQDVITMVLDLNNGALSFKINDVGFGSVQTVDTSKKYCAFVAVEKNVDCRPKNHCMQIVDFQIKKK